MSEESSTSSPDKSQTTNDSTNGSFSGWFSSFVNSAKETVNKSASTLECIKRDLSEFKEAVQNDTSSVVYSTASIVKSTLNEISNTVNDIGTLGTTKLDESLTNDDVTQMTDSSDNKEEAHNINNEQNAFNLETINSWTNLITDKAKSTINMVKESLSDSIFINRDFLIEELEDEPFVIKNDQIIPIKNWKQMLYDLQKDPDTFCREPPGPLENFDSWLTTFNLINYQKQMEVMLENIPEMKKYYEDLVPKTLSDTDFWYRYYYKVHQLKEEQKRIILESDTKSEPKTENSEISHSVNIKYLSEQSESGEHSSVNQSKTVSRSNTEEWEKMGDSQQSDVKDVDKSSSDEERDWVKCD